MRPFRHASRFLAVLILAACGCQRSAPPEVEAPARLGKVDAPGLHNVFRLTETLFSGSDPEGDEGFSSLKRLGIKTVLSVDGARPDVGRARRFGLRYVHLPIGYDGVPEAQGRRIAKAVRDMPGPVYVHCHHGKHRGPAAAAVARLCLDAGCSVETAVEGLRQAGTDPRYVGLYAAPRELRRPSAADLDAPPGDFPEAARPEGLIASMVQLDQRWDRIGAARAARWKTTPAQPDVDPPHEALQLAESFQEASRLPSTPQRPEEFRRSLAEALGGAKGLEAALRAGDDKAAESAYQRVGRSCVSCHAAYRDPPRGRRAGRGVE